MNISIEISYYPLHGEDFVEPIKAFIDRLNMHPEIEAQTNGMSTQVFGEYDIVMKILQTEIKTSFENPYSVFVMKVVNADLMIHAGALSGSIPGKLNFHRNEDGKPNRQ
jgi:uncharacterized protein YqgV (UPF0045/DUF77 family)